MLADYATGRADRNLKWGSGVPLAVRGVQVAAARGLGACRVVQEGVDAETAVAPEVLTAPGGALQCPYNAHVRIV